MAAQGTAIRERATARHHPESSDMPPDHKKTNPNSALAQPEPSPAETGAALADDWLRAPLPPYRSPSDFFAARAADLQGAARDAAREAYEARFAHAARAGAWLGAAPPTALGTTGPTRLLDLGPEIPRRIVDILRAIGDGVLYHHVRAPRKTRPRQALDAAASFADAIAVRRAMLDAAELARCGPEYPDDDPTGAPRIACDVLRGWLDWPSARADAAGDTWWPQYARILVVADPAETPPDVRP
jgi:hypothetical protein